VQGPRRKGKDNIKKDLIGCKFWDWIKLIQDRFQWREFLDTITFGLLIIRAVFDRFSNYNLLKEHFASWG
jgi:hypothetical protein